MIIREKEPANLEMPFGLLDGFITPNEQFYIRSHFPVPEVDLKTWRLKIEGGVEQERNWTPEELQELPTKTIPATLECAGNARAFFDPFDPGASDMAAVAVRASVSVFLV